MMASSFQFKEPFLTHLEYGAHSLEEGQQQDNNHQIPISFKNEVQFIGETSAYVSLTVQVAEKAEACPFYVNATMMAEFRWEPDLDSEKRDQMLRCNASALLLGYIRPIVSQITGVGPYDAVYIPFMDFTRGGHQVAQSEPESE